MEARLLEDVERERQKVIDEARRQKEAEVRGGNGPGAEKGAEGRGRVVIAIGQTM